MVRSIIFYALKRTDSGNQRASALRENMAQASEQGFFQRSYYCSNGTAHKTILLVGKSECNDWHCLHDDKRRDLTAVDQNCKVYGNNYLMK